MAIGRHNTGLFGGNLPYVQDSQSCKAAVFVSTLSLKKLFSRAKLLGSEFGVLERYATLVFCFVIVLVSLHVGQQPTVTD